MTRSMLKEKNLPKQLCGEVISTSVYLLNICPINNLKEVVPIDKWSGNIVWFSMLQAYTRSYKKEIG